MGPATDEADAAEDDLYGLPLAEFTAARNALAKRLKGAGDKESAARVQALKKPSLPAWALNQVARRHPEAVQRLLEAGDAVRTAHRHALAGDASGLRAASRAEQDEVTAVARLAASLLDQAGASGAGCFCRESAARAPPLDRHRRVPEGTGTVRLTPQDHPTQIRTSDQE